MKYIIIAFSIFAFLIAGCQTTGEKSGSMDDSMAMDNSGMMDYEFTVTVEVLSGSPTPLGPIAWVVHSGGNPLFSLMGGSRINGLEALAEDGDPSGVAASLEMTDMVSASGVAAIPSGASSPGPAVPGSSYSFTFKAHSGEKLSFATMYAQSNDLFFSPGEDGLPLFEGDHPIGGDVTTAITLYDAGTEKNEMPGSGPNQGPRQMAPNTGEDEMGQVKPVSDVMDGYMYPHVGDVLRVTVNSMM
jgi:hypothetical protein